MWLKVTKPNKNKVEDYIYNFYAPSYGTNPSSIIRLPSRIKNKLIHDKISKKFSNTKYESLWFYC